MKTPTALGIPCPRNTGINGIDDSRTLRYRAWFALYQRSRIARHFIGLHDWQTSWPEGGPPIKRCTWCWRRAA